MFSVFVKQLGDYFDRRWVLAAFFPSVAFWSANLVCTFAVIGVDGSLRLWMALDSGLQISVMLVALAWIAFFAFLLSNSNGALVRLFEGYWNDTPLLASLAAFKRARHRVQWRRMKSDAEEVAAEVRQLEQDKTNTDAAMRRQITEKREQELQLARERFLFYPPNESAIMPTRLGNILRATEMYAFERYGMDAVVLWLRLVLLLPKELGETIADARAAMDFMLNVSALGVFGGIAWGTYFAFVQQWIFVVLAILVLLLAQLAYGNALYAARTYSETIKTAFDLYRWNLLDALHIARPSKPEDEPILWEQVNQFIFRGFPLHMKFEVKAPSAVPKKDGN